MKKYKWHIKFTKFQIRYLKIKRYLDIVLALGMLTVLWPLMLILMALIKFESPGPAIFKQKRPGYQQKIFSLYKFRSMRTETVEGGKALTDTERLTKMGKFVRKTSLDELPQLINILKGEMSFIGPRPFLINDLEKYTEEQKIRFDVLPGITSWTAIHGRNNIPEQEKFNYEIEYVKRIGPKIDLEIFLKTVALVFSGKDVEDHVNEQRIAAEILEEMPEKKGQDR